MNSPVQLKRYKKVLLIDDDEVDIFISNKIIHSTSLADEVISKSSAEEGLNFLRSLSATPSELPDLIFLDLGMPVMDGLEFLNEFDKLTDAIKMKCKIFVLTNSGDSDLPSNSQARQHMVVKKILSKPLTVQALEGI